VHRALVVGIVSAVAAAISILPVLAAGAITADLIPDPPSGSWQVNSDGTGPKTAHSIYGGGSGPVQGFADAYQKSWAQPGQVLVDRLERYTSVLWAAFRFGESQGVDQKDKSHSSFNIVPGFGVGAYEFTDPPDAQGYQLDTFVFGQGDYVAAISLGSNEGPPNHSLLMDQVNRQLGQVPMPLNEYSSIGNGLTTGLFVIVGTIVVVSVLVGALVLILVLRSRRARPALVGPAVPGLNLSPDRRFWWDGLAWRDADATRPPGVYVAPDGRWWDGVAWRPSPPAQ
jgi:hypothetical protein